MGDISKTILTVENDRDSREMLVDITRSLGYHPLEAQNAREALSILQKEVVDLMLLDVHMPGIRGTQLLKFLRDQGHQIPVIVVSGYLQKNTFQELSGLNVHAALAKPFLVKRLTDEIQKVLESEQTT